MPTQVLKPQLYDSAGKPTSLPEEKIPEALVSGKFAFLKGEQIPVVNPDGETGTIPAEQAHLAFQNGYQYDTSESQIGRIKTEETSGPLKAAEAFGAGVLRGPSLGLSDQLLTRTGAVSPEDLSDLQKYRPGWSMAGEATGIGADMILNPVYGTGAAIGRVGQLAKGVVQTADAAKLAREGSVAARVLGGVNDVASHAAGSAVEGAMYAGIGNTLTENALGDPELNGQKIMSNFGYGAMLGGTLGGVLRGAEIAVPEAVKAASEGIVKVRNTLLGTGEHGDAGLLGNMMPQSLKDAIGNRVVNLNSAERLDLLEDTAKDLNAVHNNLETSLKTLNKEIRPEETSALINSSDSQRVAQAAADTSAKIDSVIRAIREEPEIYHQGPARELELWKKGLENKISGEQAPIDTFNILREAKQGLNDIVFKGSKTPSSQEVKSLNLVNGLRKDLNGMLHDPEIFGAAGSALAAHDDMLSKYYKFIGTGRPTEFQKAFMVKEGEGPNTRWQFDSRKLETALRTQETIRGSAKMKLLDDYWATVQNIPQHLENSYANVPNKRFESSQLKNIIKNSKDSAEESADKYLANIKNQKNKLGMGDYITAHLASSHPLVGAAVLAYNVATKPVEYLNKLAEVERMVGKVTKAMGKGAKSIFDPSMKAAIKGTNIGVKLSQEDRDQHGKLNEQITELQNHPDKLLDMISEHTQSFQDVAPQMAQSMQMTAARATQFLSSKLPAPPHVNPFSEPYTPSDSEIAQFERFRQVVDNPLVALNQIKEGTLTNDTVEALMVVHPKLYEEMKQTVLKAASHKAAKKEPISYLTKAQLSDFLGTPIDADFTPQAMMQNQMAMNQENANQNNKDAMGTAKPSKSGMGKIDSSSRLGINHGEMES